MPGDDDHHHHTAGRGGRRQSVTEGLDAMLDAEPDARTLAASAAEHSGRGGGGGGGRGRGAAHHAARHAGPASPPRQGLSSMSDGDLDKALTSARKALNLGLIDGGAKARARLAALEAEVRARAAHKLGGGSAVGTAAGGDPSSAWLAAAVANQEQARREEEAERSRERAAERAAGGGATTMTCAFCSRPCPGSSMVPIPPGFSVGGAGFMCRVCEREQLGGHDGGAGAARRRAAALRGPPVSSHAFYGGSADGGRGDAGRAGEADRAISPIKRRRTTDPGDGCGGEGGARRRGRQRALGEAWAGGPLPPARRGTAAAAAAAAAVPATVVVSSDDDDDDEGADAAPGPSHRGGSPPPPPPSRPLRRTRATATTTAAAGLDPASIAGLRAVYPPPDRPAGAPPSRPIAGPGGRVTLTPDHVATLDPGALLGDAVIELQLRRIVDGLPPAQAARFYVFSPFFWGKLTGGDGKRPSTGGGGGSGPFSPDDLRAALRAHARVASWTKGVDLFAKDFWLIPIHGDMHWSMLIVAHPAGVAHGGGEAAVEAARGAMAAARGLADGRAVPVPPRPFILHLDSMGSVGGHRTGPLVKAARGYMYAEWASRAGLVAPGGGGAAAPRAALPPTTSTSASDRPMSVPSAVVAASPRTTAWPAQFAPRKMSPVGLDGAAAVPAPGPPGIGHRRLSPLPTQDNGSDCGAFLLAYADFFTGCAPPVLPSGAVSDLEAVASRAESPGFLGPHWFPAAATAANLRASLRGVVLRFLADQATSTAGLAADSPPYLVALSAATDALGAAGPVGAGGGPYLGPRCPAWRADASAAAAARAAAAASDRPARRSLSRPPAALAAGAAAAARAALTGGARLTRGLAGLTGTHATAAGPAGPALEASPSSDDRPSVQVLVSQEDGDGVEVEAGGERAGGRGGRDFAVFSQGQWVQRRPDGRV